MRAANTQGARVARISAVSSLREMSFGNTLRLVNDSGGHCASTVAAVSSTTAAAIIDANRDIGPPPDATGADEEFRIATA
jgi:hypothetical protein